MWYPEIETGLKRGTCLDVNSIMSVTMRTAGSGGQIHSFWAMNSLSMSFCIVPPMRSHATPCLSAMARYMARATDAVQLMVIDVVTSPSGMSAKSRSKSSGVEIGSSGMPESDSNFTSRSFHSRLSLILASPTRRRSLEHLARDDQLLDLRRALVDLRDLRVAEVALDLGLADEAEAAVDLHGVGGDLHRRLGREELGHRRFLRVRLAGVLEAGRLQRHEPRAVDRGRHVGQHPADHLVLADRHAERLALARVPDRPLVGAGRDADRLRGDADAPAVEGGQRDVKAPALLADPVGGGDAAGIEDQLGGVGGADAELVL